ncbi:hypothetical protein BN969_24040 [Staphylococcus aureus]|nr:hypothetical protein BN969_24040 [Staphylococcus aureus]
MHVLVANLMCMLAMAQIFVKPWKWYLAKVVMVIKPLHAKCEA